MTSRGFSLVEVTVALVILEVGLLGVAGLAVLSARALGSAARTERMLLIAGSVLDSITGIAEVEAGAALAARMAGGAEPGVAAGRRETPVGRLEWEILEDGSGALPRIEMRGLDREGRRILTVRGLLPAAIPVSPEIEASAGSGGI